MKKLVLFFTLLFLSYGGGFYISRNPSLFFPQKKGEEKTSSFQPASFPSTYKPFTVLIVGKNNGAFLEKSLQSVFDQQYENYRVIYVDDASSDGSGALAKDLIDGSSELIRTTFVQNETSLGFLANLSHAIQQCAGEEIIVVLKGEDMLSHKWVLQRLNQYYQDPELWLTYSQSMDYPSYKRGRSNFYHPNESVRSASFKAYPLHSFYAALFKNIKNEDFLLHTTYFQEAHDLAYMIPMIEMAKEHFCYLPEVLYLSSEKKERENRELQVECMNQVRSFSPYEPLDTLFEKEEVR